MITQSIIFKNDGSLGKTIDSGGVYPLRDNPSSIIVGKKETLEVRMLDERMAPLVEEGWAEVTGWRFVIADDWKPDTPVLYVSHNIEVLQGKGVFVIQLENTRTQELVERLGNNESLILGCELSGYKDTYEQAEYVYQWNLQIRNRRDDGTLPPPPDYTPDSYFLRDISTGEKYKLQIWNGVLQFIKAENGDGNNE